MSGEVEVRSDREWMTLPAGDYHDAAHHASELERIWYAEWVHVGRSSTIAEPRSFRTVTIGDQSILLVRGDDGVLRGFHNTCRHRGSLLCDARVGVLGSRRISCPYHNWSYSLEGRLMATPFNDVDGMEELSLYRVAVEEWRSLVFVNLAPHGPLEDAADPGPDVLDHWPLESLVTGHTFEAVIRCNWKVFWENFLECYHCPGVHPELCDLVPLYKRGVVSADASAETWIGDGLREGATTWSMDGQPSGPVFAELTHEELASGFTFLTMFPTMYVVAHPDYVRTVTLYPSGPELTTLMAEWLFPSETLAAPGFDKANVVDFGELVMTQDAAVCELNQRGLHSIRHERGRLMPNESELRDFYSWVASRMDPTP